MDYLLSFLEGVVTFISPCLLPMLPIYLFYFAGHREAGEAGVGRTLRGALGFVLGFTVVFLALGALAGLMGSLLTRYQTAVNLVAGAVVILFGLGYLGWLPFRLFGGGAQREVKITGFLSAFVFGLVFSISWTPCVGAFLGSALIMAGQRGSMGTGILLLLCYSAGLGVPFVLSALLIDRLKGAFDLIKRHYGVITKASGALLIGVGVLMASGTLGGWLTKLARLA